MLKYTGIKSQEIKFLSSTSVMKSATYEIELSYLINYSGCFFEILTIFFGLTYRDQVKYMIEIIEVLSPDYLNRWITTKRVFSINNHQEIRYKVICFI